MTLDQLGVKRRNKLTSLSWSTRWAGLSQIIL
jgi:hypothetical protein